MTRRHGLGGAVNYTFLFGKGGEGALLVQAAWVALL